MIPEAERESLRAAAVGILHAGVAAADPGDAVIRALRLDDGVLRVASDLSLDLAAVTRIQIVGCGKAAASMARAAMARMSGRIAGGTVTVPCEPPQPVPRLEVWEGGHPIPNVGGLAGASEALATARGAREGELLLCLLSGGASSLWAAPAPGLTLADLQASTLALLRCGAPIQVVNTIRKHLSGIAGGRLARAARPAKVLTLAASDVIGAPDDAIGSGPTLPDSSTFADALELVGSYAVPLPPAVLRHLRIGAAGGAPETARTTELDNLLGFVVVLDIEDALAGAEAEARRRGFRTRIVSPALQGEARDEGRKVAAEALRARDEGKGPVVLLWGGETTVTVRGVGRGGRNQELALAAAVELRGAAGVVVASMGTDGVDGPTDAAGGVVDGETVDRGSAAGRDADTHLAANDSYAFLQATGDLIVTGATGTNVNDLVVAVVRG